MTYENLVDKWESLSKPDAVVVEGKTLPSKESYLSVVDACVTEGNLIAAILDNVDLTYDEEVANETAYTETLPTEFASAEEAVTWLAGWGQKKARVLVAKKMKEHKNTVNTEYQTYKEEEEAKVAVQVEQLRSDLSASLTNIVETGYKIPVVEKEPIEATK